MQVSPDRQKCLNYVLHCKQRWRPLCPTFSLSERRRNQNSACSSAFKGVEIVWLMEHRPENSVSVLSSCWFGASSPVPLWVMLLHLINNLYERTFVEEGHRVKAIIRMRGAANLCKSAMDGWLNWPLGLFSHQVLTQFLKSKNVPLDGQQSTESNSTFLFWSFSFMHHYYTTY